MNSDFATAMRRALESTRAQNPGEATTIIQRALAGQAPDNGSGRSNAHPAGRPPRARFSLVDPAADDAETVGDPEGAAASAPPADTGPRVRPGHGLPFSLVDGATRARSRPADAGLSAGPAGSVRRSLRAVVDSLAKGGSGPGVTLPGMRAHADPPAIPEGARWEARSFSCAAGSRAYRLYVPANLPEERRGLIVMLHGCTQSPEDFASGTRMNAVAEAHGLIVAWPEQTMAHNASSCWNWFRPGDQRKGAGEPAIIAGLTRELAAEFEVDRTRIFAAGLSAGGAMAAVLAEAYPELYSAVGIHSGLPAGSANDVASAFAAMRGDEGWGGARRAPAGARVRTIIFHGAADRTVHPSNAERIVGGLADGADPAEVSRGHAPGGRGYTRSVLRAGDGGAAVESWLIDGAGHAWSGGDTAGSYTDPSGPDASAEMVRFFLSLPEEASA